MWAAKDDRTAVVSFLAGIPLITGGGILIILVGVIARSALGFTPESPNLIFYELIFGTLPIWFAALMFVVLIAAILSTADTYFMAGSTVIVSDIIKPLFKVEDDAKLLLYSRWMVAVMAVISLVLSL